LTSAQKGEKLTPSKKSLVLSSLKMASATFSSRILGLVREQVMAATFGASGITDAFTVAYRVPNMLRDLFAEGAFSSAFVPVFTEQRLKDPQLARKLLWSLVVVLGVLTSILSILIIVFAPELVGLITNVKFTQDTERLQITVQLVRLMAPFLTLISLAALFMGALNSLKVFFVPALAPAFFNVVMIASMLILPPILEAEGFHSIFSLGVGVIGGGLIQMLVQIPLLFRKNFGPIGGWKLITDETKKILHRLGIGTIGIAATQINILVTTVLATGTQLGAVSWLTYAFRLFQFPVGILSVSIAGSNLVHFSDDWKAGKKEEAIKTLGTSYLFSWFSIIPAFALLYALNEETVNIIFQRGVFDREDTDMTAMALRFYLLGLPFYGLYKIFAPTFFTLDRPKIPVFISVAAIALNLAFCLYYVPLYGFKILALGTSLSMMLNCFLQSIILKRLLDLRLYFFFPIRLFKFFVGGVFCFAVTHYSSQYWFDWESNQLMRFASYALCAGLGSAVYLLSVLLMGEMKMLKILLRR
jgi:putative peptidoglycan lipid II flippase